MTGLALVGALLGATFVALLSRVIPARPSALVQLGRLDAAWRPATLPTLQPGLGEGLLDRAGERLNGELARHGIGQARLRQDLALTGQDVPQVMGRKVLAAVAGLLITLVCLVTVQLTVGAPLPILTPLPVALTVAAGFFFLPDLEARKRATRRREDFRRALGAYLDLVALEMAGAAAPAQALTSAARIGNGWPFALLRDTLYRAHRSGNDPWTALTELGELIGVTELRDLGALVRLVSHDGARVRQTLTARAAAMRRRDLADAQGQAEERDVSMRLAQLVVAAGFMVFLAYPAIVNVLAI